MSASVKACEKVEEINEAFCAACYYSRFEVVDDLLNKGIDKEVISKVFFFALVRGNIKMAKYLYKLEPVDIPENKFHYFIQVAFMNKNLGLLDFLILIGLDLDYYGIIIFSKCCNFDNLDMLKLCIERRRDKEPFTKLDDPSKYTKNEEMIKYINEYKGGKDFLTCLAIKDYLESL